MGALLTLAVLMLQGGIHTLLYQRIEGAAQPTFPPVLVTILGGGLLAGCLALVMNRLR